MPSHDHAGQMSRHSHGQTRFDDWNTHADRLIRDGEIGLPCLEQAAAWLARSVDPADILDIGSGPGVATGVLGLAFPAARLTAIDGAEALLDLAQQRAQRLGVSNRLNTMIGDLDGGLAELPDADLIWASRVIHHLPDQPKALRALASHLKPGGMIALVEGGLPTRFLPEECGVGAPGLLYRLDAAVSQGLAPMLQHDEQSPVPRPTLDWPHQLTEAGLTPSGSRTFLLDLPSPVTAQVREHLADRLQQTFDVAGDHLADVDRVSVHQLLDSSSELSVWHRPDLFLLSASTVHTARLD